MVYCPSEGKPIYQTYQHSKHSSIAYIDEYQDHRARHVDRVTDFGKNILVFNNIIIPHILESSIKVSFKEVNNYTYSIQDYYVRYC